MYPDVSSTAATLHQEDLVKPPDNTAKTRIVLRKHDCAGSTNEVGSLDPEGDPFASLEDSLQFGSRFVNNWMQEHPITTQLLDFCTTDSLLPYTLRGYGESHHKSRSPKTR